jgi:hypothetical protein
MDARGIHIVIHDIDEQQYRSNMMQQHGQHLVHMYVISCPTVLCCGMFYLHQRGVYMLLFLLLLLSIYMQVLRTFLCANANMPPPRLEITWANKFCPSLDEMEVIYMHNSSIMPSSGQHYCNLSCMRLCGI